MGETDTLTAPPALADIDRPALFLDFDGTLVDIAATPDDIVVPAGLGERLAALGRRFDGRLALISGRTLRDIERHLGRMAFCRAGSHGIDCRRSDGSPLSAAPKSLPGPVVVALEAFAEERGLTYEAKSHGGALHFRADPAAGGPARVFAERLAARYGLEIKGGKRVVELVRPGADKGAAVRAFMAQPGFAGATPIFVGDDQTDEDGFRAARELGGFGVIVGEREDTLAVWRLSTVAEVHRWLNL